jgi:hypothetical protein
MKSRHAASYVRAFKSVLKFFASLANPLTFLVLDNETSSELTALFRSQQFSLPFQHIPPLVHRVNKAECAVQTAKNHLISVLSSAHITFPPDRWPKLLASAELSLNHLRRVIVGKKTLPSQPGTVSVAPRMTSMLIAL